MCRLRSARFSPASARRNRPKWGDTIRNSRGPWLSNRRIPRIMYCVPLINRGSPAVGPFRFISASSLFRSIPEAHRPSPADPDPRPSTSASGTTAANRPRRRPLMASGRDILTYGEFQDTLGRLVRLYAERGLQREDRVAVADARILLA